MSRKGKNSEPITTIHRQEWCLWCGAELAHAATGRPKEFCSSHCRVYYARARKEHARRCAEAALTGRPEPEADFGYPRSTATYEIRNGEVVKRKGCRRPGGRVPQDLRQECEDQQRCS